MKQESTQATSVNALNRAKMYQLVLFPMNNGATNVYYILTMNFIAYYANGVLGLLLAFATTMVTLMRAGDAFIDPIIGAIMDRTSTKWGKFRPFMVIGNLIMIVSSILLYFGTRIISEDMMWLRYLCFILFYALNMVGYTFQTSVTRSGQTCLTNDPKQRPLFTIFNTIASLIGMGLVQFLAPIVTGGNYRTEEFFNIMIPLAMIVSAIMTALAVIGIAEKDRPEFFGLGGEGGKEKEAQEDGGDRGRQHYRSPGPDLCGICHILQQPFHVLYEDQWDGLLSEKRKPGGGLYEAAGGGLCLNA